ncbi:hypothetical protein [Vibrio parahaemolyticus]|uniref:hypothetical protein n=1 Tax=Vibrio parahaemolyticus TaxID=670 RepID=UPI001F5082F7|nr:hypothetical protein [Vibrio parahaemolyticus]
MSTNIVYTEAFENMTDDQINYLSLWSEEDVVVERIETLVEKFESNITDNPEMHPPCHELTTLGVYNIRQFAVSYTQIPKLVAWGFFLNSFKCV